MNSGQAKLDREIETTPPIETVPCRMFCFHSCNTGNPQEDAILVLLRESVSVLNS